MNPLLLSLYAISISSKPFSFSSLAYGRAILVLRLFLNFCLIISPDFLLPSSVRFSGVPSEVMLRPDLGHVATLLPYLSFIEPRPALVLADIASASLSATDANRLIVSLLALGLSQQTKSTPVLLRLDMKCTSRASLSSLAISSFAPVSLHISIASASIGRSRFRCSCLLLGKLFNDRSVPGVSLNHPYLSLKTKT